MELRLPGHPALQRPPFVDFPGFAFTFEAPDHALHPRYRYLPNTVTPMGLATNQFGWRGPAVELRKPPQTIRIAFAGASTTVGSHGYHHFYPELVGHWLNRWATQQGLSIRFEIQNLGREGIDSTDIAAIVHTEALPVEPDFIVYYEGSNQFWPGSILPGLGHPQRTGLELLTNPARTLIWLARYSSLLRRLEIALGSLTAHPGAEEPKPLYQVSWPPTVDEQDPPLHHDHLPVNLSRILKDLDRIRLDAESIQARMVLTSFFWLVRDGMVLDPIRHHSILRYLNVGLYPYRYREMERLAAFQNRVFAKYASNHHLPFIDVAGEYPFDPDLFNDAIHFTYPGVRLHAWLVLQHLIPLVTAEMAAGRLPRSAVSKLPPPLPENIRTVRTDCRIDEVSLASLTPGDTESQLLPGEVVRLVTAARPNHLAATLTLPLPPPSPGGERPPGEVEVTIKVLSGKFRIGFLDIAQQMPPSNPLIEPGNDWQPIKMKIKINPKTGQARTLFFANGPGPDTASTALIRSIRIKTNKMSLTPLAPGITIPPSRTPATRQKAE